MKKRFLAFLLALIMVVSLLPAGALAEEYTGTCGDNLKWSLKNGTLTISGTGAMKDYADSTSKQAPWDPRKSQIKSVVISSKVTSIGNSAFYECDKLTSVTIPKSVKSIGDSAFFRCIKLQSIAIPDGVTSIGNSAFYGCKELTGVALPDSLTSIGNSAFALCKKLASITLPDSVTSIGGNAFQETPWLKEQGDFVIHNGMLIKYQGGNRDVTIPEGVMSICDCAFYNASLLRSVTIPDGVTTIGNRAFFQSSLKSITIPDSVTTIGESAFMGTISLESLTIPDSVTSLGACAFYNSYICEVTIGTGITSIEKSTFYECRNLTSVTIPENITKIGNNAFSYCTNLQSAEFMGNAPTSFGKGVFDFCGKDFMIYVPKGNTTWSESAAYDVAAQTWKGYPIELFGRHEHNYIAELTPVTCTDIGYTTYTCDVCGRVTVDDYIDPLGHDFQNGVCTRCGISDHSDRIQFELSDDGVLTLHGTGPMEYDGIFTPWYAYIDDIRSVVIDEGITSISYEAFALYPKLESIVIPASMEKIEESAFFLACKLKSVYISDLAAWCGIEFCDSYSNPISSYSDVYEAGEQVLPGKYSTVLYVNGEAVKELVIPDGVEKLSKYAFLGLAALTKVTIPESVTYIDDAVFYGCGKLKAAKFLGDAPKHFGTVADPNGAPLKADQGVDTVFGECYDFLKLQIPVGNKTWTGSSLYNAKNRTWNGYLVEFYGEHEHTYKDGACTICDAPDPNYVEMLSIFASNVASSGKIKLTWTKSDNAVKYELWRATSKNGKFTKLATTTGTSFTNTSTTAGKTYYYKVRGIAADGSAGEFSAVRMLTCDCAQPVVKLTNVASTGKIKISWDKVAGASKYEVWRSTSKDGSYSRITTTKNTSFTNTATTAGKKYYYKVRALCEPSDEISSPFVGADGDGNSAFSAIHYLVCDLARPTAKITTSSGHPKLSWAKVTGATKYEVYRATSKSGTYSKVTTVTGTSYTDKSAKKGKTYYYKVKAVCNTAAAASAYSTIVSIKAK